MMQIDAIEVFHVALPLCRPRQSAAGPLETLETVLLSLRSGETVGWGEVSPGNAPLASPEWAAGVFGCVQDWLAPAVVGRSIASGDELTQCMAPFAGNRFAKAALDLAWWDLGARLKGEPLHRLIGGERDAVEVGMTFDQMESFDEFLDAIRQAVAAGFGRIRLKLRPGWDVRMIGDVRGEFPLTTIHIDAEGQLELQHMEMLCRFDDFGLAMIEQPLAADDLIGHAMVQEAVRTSLCLSSSVTDPIRADMALELKSCQYINLEPGRVGGLTPAIAIHDACHSACVGCFAGAVPQSAVGARFSLALAAKSNCTYPADFVASDELFETDLAEPLLPQANEEDGKMRVSLWSKPGIGVEPNAELLKQYTLAKATILS